jgi:hypothetical protein
MCKRVRLCGKEPTKDVCKVCKCEVCGEPRLERKGPKRHWPVRVRLSARYKQCAKHLSHRNKIDYVLGMGPCSWQLPKRRHTK